MHSHPPPLEAVTKRFMMKDIFKTKNFKILIATLIIIIMCIGVSSVFDTSIISSTVGYITTAMQRVSATVVGLSLIHN